jgi:2-dehydro-3-deoxyphosphogluconate aldolase / (4S)-4-hydroxy-2-oxoglutarate aldolase
MNRVVAHLRAHPVLAILRGVPAEHVVSLGHALLAGGVRSIEVALTDADASDKIAALVAALGDAGAPRSAGLDADRVVIGAGTVTTRDRAAAAHAVGADFLVTPHVAAAVNAYAREHALPVVCGATTPSEIAVAREQGAALIKLFPAGPLGTSYLRALLGPYPDLEVFAVGGVGAENARAFLEAGAVGLGVGGALTSLDWTSPDFDAVSTLARELVELVSNERESRP